MRAGAAVNVRRAFRLVYLRVRHLVRMHLARVARARARRFLAMPVDRAPQADDRSSIGRFQRESGLR